MTDKETLYQVYLKADAEMRRKWNRSLPFQDTLDDRWERAKRLGFGTGTSLYNSSVVMGDVTVGENSWIGPFVLLEGAGGGIEIGSTCSISTGVHIYTHDSLAWSLSGGTAPYVTAPVRIADRCYVGPQSIIAAGVTMGAGSVLAANSYLNTDIPPATIWGGSPARQLGRVESDGTQFRLVYDNGGERCL